MRRVLALLFLTLSLGFTGHAEAQYQRLCKIGVFCGQLQPILSFNFAQFAGSGTCPSPLSCSRTSNAMMIDASGLLTYAPNNLLTNSNAFGSAPWSTIGGTCTATTGQADPLGGTSAVQIQAGTSCQWGQTFNAGVQNGANYLFSVWLRAASPESWQVGFYDGANFEEHTFSVTTTWTQYYFVATSTNTSAAPRFQIVTVSDDGSTIFAYFPTMSAVTHETTPRPADQVATGASAYYGPRYDYTYGSPLLHVEAYSATNLLLQSNGLSTTWSATNLTLAQNASSPDGTTDAWTLTDNSTSGVHDDTQAITVGSGATITISGYFAQGTGRYACLQAANGSNLFGVAIDTQAHTATNASAGTGTITSTGVSATAINELYYYWATGSISGYTTYTVGVGLANASATSGCPSYTGSGSTIIAYGIEAKAQSFPDSSIPTTTAQVTRAADVDQLAFTSFPWAGSAYGTLAIKFTVPVNFNNGGFLLGTYGSGGGQGITLRSSDTASWSDGGSGATTGNAFTPGTVARIVVRCTPTTESIVMNNGAIVRATRGSGAIAGTGWQFGTAQGGTALGPEWFAALRFYSKAVNDNQAQALAAGGF